MHQCLKLSEFFSRRCVRKFSALIGINRLPALHKLSASLLCHDLLHRSFPGYSDPQAGSRSGHDSYSHLSPKAIPGLRRPQNHIREELGDPTEIFRPSEGQGGLCGESSYRALRSDLGPRTSDFGPPTTDPLAIAPYPYLCPYPQKRGRSKESWRWCLMARKMIDRPRIR